MRPSIMPATPAPEGCGVGLANTRDRLRFLYGDAQHLEVGDRPGGGYEARGALPFHTAPRRAATPEVD